MDIPVPAETTGLVEEASYLTPLALNPSRTELTRDADASHSERGPLAEGGIGDEPSKSMGDPLEDPMLPMETSGLRDGGATQVPSALDASRAVLSDECSASHGEQQTHHEAAVAPEPEETRADPLVDSVVPVESDLLVENALPMLP